MLPNSSFGEEIENPYQIWNLIGSYTVIHTHANYDRCKPEFGVCSEQYHCTGDTPITPAPETSDSDDDSSSSSDSNDESAGPSDDDDSNADNNNDLQDTSSTDDGDSSSDDGDSQDTSSSEEEDDTEDDSEPTNPLLEQIRNSVNGALSASGMPGPGF